MDPNNERLGRTCALGQAKRIVEHQLEVLWSDRARASVVPPLMLWGPPGGGRGAALDRRSAFGLRAAGSRRAAFPLRLPRLGPSPLYDGAQWSRVSRVCRSLTSSASRAATQQLPSGFSAREKGGDSPQSDVDLLVDLERGRSLLDLVGIEQDLEDRLGCKVDVVTRAGLSPYLRAQILAQALPLSA